MYILLKIVRKEKKGVEFHYKVFELFSTIFFFKKLCGGWGVNDLYDWERMKYGSVGRTKIIKEWFNIIVVEVDSLEQISSLILLSEK